MKVRGKVQYFGPREDPDELIGRGRHFQIKAGTSPAPWQRAWIKDELFGKKSVAAGNLGIAVRNCLTDSGRYVLVCFGVDLTSDRRAKAQ